MLKIEKSTFTSGNDGLKELLEDVEKLMNREMGDVTYTILIKHDSSKHAPMAYRENNDIVINLSDLELLWANYIFQFAHEYCHVRTNFQTCPTNYLWIEEVFSHMASHYCLLTLSEQWKTAAPFKNWTLYAINLKQYSETIKKDKQCNISYENVSRNTFNFNQEERAFFEFKEKELREMLDSNESYGSFWKAVTYWNTWDINVVDTEECVFNKWIEILPQDLKKVAEDTKKIIIKQA